MRAPVEYHEGLADRWEAKYSRPSFRSRIDAVDSLLGSVAVDGAEWLDAGCGTGTLSRLLATRGCSVQGVDASPAMIEKARQLSAQCDRPIRFQRIETIESLPFHDATFDGLLCLSVLEYLEAVEPCCREFLRVLKPGGVLLVSVPNRRSAVRLAQKVCFRISGLIASSPRPAYLALSKHDFGVGQFGRLLRRVGFRVRGHRFCGAPIPGPIGRSRWVASLILVLAERPAGAEAQP